MSRSRFFNKKFEFLTLAQILEITGAVAHKESDLSKKIFDISTLDKSDEEKI